MDLRCLANRENIFHLTRERERENVRLLREHVLVRSRREGIISGDNFV